MREPEWVAITCYHALDGARDQRAKDALQLGATLIEQKVALLSAESQGRYLDACPAAREVLDTWRKLQDAEEYAGATLSLVPAATPANRPESGTPRVAGSLAPSG